MSHKTKEQEAAFLQFTNAACIVAEGPEWKGSSSDIVQIRRADLEDLSEKLAKYRRLIGVKVS